MIGPCYFKKINEDTYLLTNDTGNFCFLSGESFDSLVRKRNVSIIPAEDKQVLLERLFIDDGTQEEFIRKYQDDLRRTNRYLMEPTSLFILAMTNECNNRCVYCQANGPAELCHMSEHVAEQILQCIAGTSVKSLTLEFQGGEPLVNYKTIRYILNRATQILADRDIHFALVTNLALMTDEIAAELAEHHVSVSTSLDGFRELHDHNRPCATGESSYDLMLRGKAILEKHGITCGAIQTTTREALQYPREIVREYVRLGFGQIFLRPLSRLGAAAKRWDEIGYTPDEYLEFYKTALDEIIKINLGGTSLMEYHSGLFLSKMLSGRSVNFMELRSPCGAGIGQLAFTANGNVYTCDEGRMIAESGDEAFRLGNVFKDSYSDMMSCECCKAVTSASFLEVQPGCCDCVYKPYCGICPVINYALNGSITSLARDRCRIYHGMLDILFDYLYGNSTVVNLFQKWGDQA